MKIVESGLIGGSVMILHEDWHMDYDFLPESSTVAAYPVSKESLYDSSFMPRRGETFRLQMNFENADEAKYAYDSLRSGEKVFKDYAKNFDRPEYIVCL